MKRLFLIVIALLLPVICLAQHQKAKVTLKNGTSLIGAVTELNPTSHVKLIVGGFETTINMGDIESIENFSKSNSEETITIPEQTTIAAEAYDYDGLPEVYNMAVGPYVIEMKLIKGTTFSMGYDGDGSLRMNSEPVHEVALSSFYINTRPLNKDVVGYLKKGKEEHGKPNSIYRPYARRDAKEVAVLVAEASKLPVDLITEAQWEYIAVNVDGIFDPSITEWNYCYDYYGSYTSSKTVQVDPKGPKTGKYYVKRKFGKDQTSIYTRFDSWEDTATNPRAIRITLPAKSIK